MLEVIRRHKDRVLADVIDPVTQWRRSRRPAGDARAVQPLSAWRGTMELDAASSGGLLAALLFAVVSIWAYRRRRIGTAT